MRNGLSILVHDAESRTRLGRPAGFRVLNSADSPSAENSQGIIVIVAASELPQVAAFVRNANRHHHLKALLVRADLDGRWIAHLLERARLRTLKNLFVCRGWESLNRVVESWSAGVQDRLIADAVVIRDRLLVVSCGLERLEVPFKAIRCLKGIPVADRARFEIDPDGSHIFWPASDVHLDWDSLRFAVDEPAGRSAKAEGIRRNARIGAAISALRSSTGLSTECIAGVSGRQLRRIETGECVPRTTTMEKLANSHGMTLTEYLDSLAKSLAVIPQ